MYKNVVSMNTTIIYYNYKNISIIFKRIFFQKFQHELLVGHEK